MAVGWLWLWGECGHGVAIAVWWPWGGRGRGTPRAPPAGGQFKREVTVDGQSHLLLIREEAGAPDAKVGGAAGGRGGRGAVGR